MSLDSSQRFIGKKVEKRYPPQEEETMSHPSAVARAGDSLTSEQNFRKGRKHAKTSPGIVKIEDLEEDDIVIAVMGSTGSGKSTFIRTASGCDTVGVGYSLRSFTSQVVAVRFLDQESGRYVVLVDTPGFDDTYKSDLEILDMISDWLNKSYGNKTLLSGLLYLHRITNNRMAGTPLKNLRVFRKLCGRHALDKVYLTTTMWDEVEQGVGERRLEELMKVYWKLMVDGGARVVRCRGDDDSPKKLLRDLLDGMDGRRVLQLQDEMVNQKTELKDTAAGQQLSPQVEALVGNRLELLRIQRIERERKTTPQANVLVDGESRSQLDSKRNQTREPNWLKNIRRFVNFVH